MRNVLIVLNSGTKEGLEPFFYNEIPFLESDFDEIRIFPTETIKPFQLSQKVIVTTNPEKKLSKFRFLQVLLIREFWKESIDIITQQKGHFLKKILQLISFLAVSTNYLNFVYQKLQKEYNSDENANFIFYSYWMNIHSYVGIRLSKRFKNSRAISRCHGYDIYEYRTETNYLPLRRYILKNLYHLFSISENGKQYLQQKYSNLNFKISVSHLGTTDYGLNCSKRLPNLFTIVSCSFMVPLKRIHKIIESLSLIDDYNIIWTHIGDGPKMNEILELSKNLPKNIKCRFLGTLTIKEIRDFYLSNYCDVFINTSSTEGIPVTIMEAMSFGIPVIATDVGGTGEIVKNGNNGYLLNPEFKNEDLSNLIIEMINMVDKDFYKLRHNARESWENQFSACRNYPDFLNSIKSSI